MEDADIQTSVHRVITTSVCGAIYYEIIGGNDGSAFYIDNSGTIYVNNSLDFEARSSYLLEVRALYKNGNDFLQATPRNSTVNVTVVDVNEPPYWNTTATPNIIEFCFDPKLNESVGRVQALDPDTVTSFVYLHDGGPTSLFRIDSLTGDIVRGHTHLSTISFTTYSLTVYAKDPNSLELQTPSHLITLNWCDFTTPNFLGDLIQNVTICEGPTNFQRQFLTAAQDVHYVIESGDPFDKFNISNDGGLLHVISPLDRENTNSYQLIISAQGMFGRGNYSDNNLTVNIDVCDINDNDPSVEVIYTPVLYVGILYPNFTVMAVNASDPDAGENGTLTYAWNITTLTPQMTVINDVLVINGTLSTSLAGTKVSVNITVCDGGINRRCTLHDNETIGNYIRYYFDTCIIFISSQALLRVGALSLAVRPNLLSLFLFATSREDIFE